MDPIGFSHEYGFDCVPALETWEDQRILLPIGTGVALAASLLVAFAWRSNPSVLGLVAVHWAWLLTLFPISGIVKVGTFIADRIVVASTVSVSIWIGWGLTYWITTGIHSSLPAKPLQGVIIGWILVMSYLKVHTRTLQWMDSISLLSSSLETCPRFAKGHMEMSKIYSGLFPDMFDLGKARWHLDQAKAIDPDLCDYHQQYAHVAIQEGNYLEHEEELTQAVLCPFTMGGAMEMWKRYWQVSTNTAKGKDLEEIQARQMYYTGIIQQAAEKQENERRAKKKASSPLAGWNEDEL